MFPLIVSPYLSFQPTEKKGGRRENMCKYLIMFFKIAGGEFICGFPLTFVQLCSILKGGTLFVYLWNS